MAVPSAPGAGLAAASAAQAAVHTALDAAPHADQDAASDAPPDAAPDAHDIRAAAFFDLDKTVIAKSSTLAFSRSFYRGGLLTRRGLVRTAYAQVSYVFGRAGSDQVERMRAFLTRLVTGWDVSLVQRLVAETLHELIDPIIYAEAMALIEAHRAAGRDVVVVSASGAEVVRPIGALLGAEHVVATEMVVEDGRYTGEIETYVYGEAKAQAVRRLAQEQGYDLAACYAYSDSVTDLPMLEVVGHPAVVNPDRALRREALARGWEVLVFTRPVRLRDRAHAEPPVLVAAVATAVTGAVVWWAASHWRTPAAAPA